MLAAPPARLPPPPTASPSTSQVLTSASIFAGQNLAVAGAPLLNHLNPQMNSLGVGGPEVLAITAGLNALAQWVKMWDFFDQNKYLIPLLLLLGLVIAVILWHDDMRRALMNAMLSVDTAVKNYGQLRTVGVMSQGTPTQKDMANG